MRDTCSSLRRSASFGVFALCISGLIYWILPKTLKSTATFILALVAGLTCWLWIEERSKRRRIESLASVLTGGTKGSLAEMELSQRSLEQVRSCPDVLITTKSADQGKRVIWIEAKASRQLSSAVQKYFWEELPRLWELFSLMLPTKIRRDAFEPAYNDLVKDYVLVRKYHGKWARRWIGLAFTARTLWMVFDCFRVLFQSAVGKTVLSFLPSVGMWFRRQ